MAASVTVPAAVSARASDAVEPDADLIILGHEWAHPRERLDAAWEEHDAAADHYGDGPPPSPELFVRQSDNSLPYYASKHQPSGLKWYGTPSIMERIRNLPLDRMPVGILLDGSVRRGGLEPAGREPAGRTDPSSRMPTDPCGLRVPDLPARARRAEIMAAYERWQAACATAVDACGLTVVIASTNAEIETNSALRRRIIDLPAVTLKGLLVKAQVAVQCHGGLEEMRENAFKRSPTDEALMCSLVLDLIKMEGVGL